MRSRGQHVTQTHIKDHKEIHGNIRDYMEAHNLKRKHIEAHSFMSSKGHNLGLIRHGNHSLVHLSEEKKDPIQVQQNPYGDKFMMSPLQAAFGIYGWKITKSMNQ